MQKRFRACSCCVTGRPGQDHRCAAASREVVSRDAGASSLGACLLCAAEAGQLHGVLGLDEAGRSVYQLVAGATLCEAAYQAKQLHGSSPQVIATFSKGMTVHRLVPRFSTGSLRPRHGRDVDVRSRVPGSLFDSFSSHVCSQQPLRLAAVEHTLSACGGEARGRSQAQAQGGGVTSEQTWRGPSAQRALGLHPATPTSWSTTGTQ